MVNCRPSVDRQSADCWPTVGRVSTNSRPTVGRQSANRFCPKYRLPTGFLGSSSSQLPKIKFCGKKQKLKVHAKSNTVVQDSCQPLV